MTQTRSQLSYFHIFGRVYYPRCNVFSKICSASVCLCYSGRFEIAVIQICMAYYLARNVMDTIITQVVNFSETPSIGSVNASLTSLYLRWHSPEAGCVSITNCVDDVSHGGTPGSAVRRQLTRHVHPAISPSCVAEDSRSGCRLQIGLDRTGWPRARLRHVRGGVGRRRSLIS